MSDHSNPKTHTSSPVQTFQVTLRPKNLGKGLDPEYVITHFPATIGRHPTNDIELPFEAISRYHSRLEIAGDHLRLVDLRSSNGTWVNGDRVQMALVEDQDSLAFGSLEFTLTIQEQPADGLPAADESTSSIQFLVDDAPFEAVYRTELPEDTSSGVSYLDEEITNEQQLKKAKQRLMCLYRLQDVLRTTTDEKKLLARVLTLLFDILPVDRGVILLRESTDPSIFRPMAIKTKQGPNPEKIGISKTILQRCLKERVAILTRDAASDERFNAADSIMSNRMRSVMCVPLISMRHVFGFCHLDTMDDIRSFTQADLTFLANVGAEVATHLHNLRMFNDRLTSERMAAIGQTITGMAHNIKNILVLSQGGIEMMEKRLHRKNYDTLEETWSIVRRGLDRINRLTQDMLDYSRARTVEKSKLQINDLVQDLQQSMLAEFAKRRMRLELELDESCPALILDHAGLERCLENLIVNAMEACNEGDGQIVLSTRMTPEGNLVLGVRDNGSGIPKEVLSRIYIPFFTTKGSRGSGLGLAMTKKIVEDMSGSLDVSTQEGQGTEFTITLYVAPGTPRVVTG